jgi:hypothetical protein
MKVTVQIEFDCIECQDLEDMKESIAQALDQMKYKGFALAHIETPANESAEITFGEWNIKE